MPSQKAKPPRRQRGKRPQFTDKAKTTASSQRFFTWTQPTHLCHTLTGGWIIFVAHALGVALLFQPVVGLFDSKPLTDQDWGLHFHHLRSMETFWAQDRLLTGYNPFFMAGYPSNTIQDLSIKLFEFAALILAVIALTPTQWFKLTAFVAMASAPWLMHFAARNFFYDCQFKQFVALGASLLGTLYWWNSLPREMFFYGMIGFPVAAYVSVWGVSLFYRLAHTRAITPAHFGWLAFAAIILPLHAQSLLIFLPPLLALLALEPKLLKRNLLISLFGAGALSLLANSFWLLPAVAHRGDDVSQSIVAQLPLFTSSDLLTFIIDYIGTNGYWTFRPTFLEKGFRLALLIIGALGVGKLIRSEQRSLGILLAVSLIGLFLLSYFGTFIPMVRTLQPLRFKIPFDLFLVVGAAYAIGRQFQSGDVTSPRLMRLLLGGATLTFVVNLVQSESIGRLQLRSQLHPDSARIVEWIRQEAPAEGRVLFEESGDETEFVHDGVYLSSFVPHLTGRQLIGGPINLYNDRHHFAEFHSGQLFKRDLGALSDAELRNYLSLYNIGAIAAFHPASLQRFQAIPGLVTLDQRIGPVHLLKVNQALTWFVQGQGKINAQLNRLELTELTGNPVILKYHWIAGLKGEPAAKIEPVQLADDPIPFIKIIDPPPALILRAEP